jgi:hypothetical protein
MITRLKCCKNKVSTAADFRGPVTEVLHFGPIFGSEDFQMCPLLLGELTLLSHFSGSVLIER